MKKKIKLNKQIQRNGGDAISANLVDGVIWEGS